MDMNTIGIISICIILFLIFGRIFIWPLKKILKLVINSILGGLLIYIINVIGMNFDFHIGLNLVTSLLVGFLGVPGAALLVILKIILRMKQGDGSFVSFFEQKGHSKKFKNLNKRDRHCLLIVM